MRYRLIRKLRGCPMPVGVVSGDEEYLLGFAPLCRFTGRLLQYSNRKRERNEHEPKDADFPYVTRRKGADTRTAFR